MKQPGRCMVVLLHKRRDIHSGHLALVHDQLAANDVEID